MQFEFLPLRFEFVAAESLDFPPGKAANTLRGALGIVLRRISCTSACQADGDPRTCATRHSCPYARTFAPVADACGPSGLNDPPRPFVFRARHLDGRSVPPGVPFYFDLNLFPLDPAILACFIHSFSAVALEGLGPHRGKAQLRRVLRVAAAGSPEQVVHDPFTPIRPRPPNAVTLDLRASPAAPSRIQVAFLSPTELKHQGRLVGRPEFPVLFARIRDRISAVRGLYGQGPLDIDFKESGQRAAAIRMTRWEGHHIETERHSSRTGQNHPIGGFAGVAEYEGDLAEFVPYLEAARWTGVGRQSVWGKGETAVTILR